MNPMTTTTPIPMIFLVVSCALRTGVLLGGGWLAPLDGSCLLSFFTRHLLLPSPPQRASFRNLEPMHASTHVHVCICTVTSPCMEYVRTPTATGGILKIFVCLFPLFRCNLFDTIIINTHNRQISFPPIPMCRVFSIEN